MPCGGIRPFNLSVVSDALEGQPTPPCHFCNKPGATHWVEEWDTAIHARCVPAFLQTEEGEIIIEHGHDVYLDFSLEREEEQDAGDTTGSPSTST
jgi:hypothetical protein